MIQQVDVIVKLTLEVNAELSKVDIENELDGILQDNLFSVNSDTVDVLTEHNEIISIKEEGEIYSAYDLGFSFKAEGNANAYTIFKHGNWIMTTQINGQLHTQEQIKMMESLVKCLNNGKASH